MVMLVRPICALNAQSPMAATVKPVIVSGMTTTPLVPVYPVMVIVPLLVT
jgi:hypothetical protein